jgi:hypothetical protein
VPQGLKRDWNVLSGKKTGGQLFHRVGRRLRLTAMSIISFRCVNRQSAPEWPQVLVRVIVVTQCRPSERCPNPFLTALFMRMRNRCNANSCRLDLALAVACCYGLGRLGRSRSLGGHFHSQKDAPRPSPGGQRGHQRFIHDAEFTTASRLYTNVFASILRNPPCPAPNQINLN